MPATQRVLMNDVPGQAVFALLRYLYTARCAIPESLRPHMLELASRFLCIYTIFVFGIKSFGPPLDKLIW